MKGNAAVIADLETAINLELTLSLQYLLDSRNLKRYGLKKPAAGFATLAGQSHDFATKMASRVLFLDGAPSSS